MATAREKALNRARVAKHTQRRNERVQAIMGDVLRYMRREPIKDDFGNMKGYAVTFNFPDDAYDRFEALAQEHNRTAKQLMHETMEIFCPGSAKAEG